MEPTQVRVGVMDIQRLEEIQTVEVRRLGSGERLWRGARRFFGVSGFLLLLGNIALLMLPIPHLHLCLFPLALFLGPVLGWFRWKDSVVLAEGQLPCPRCRGAVTIPPGVSGWPARFNCERCAIMVELKPA